MTFCTCPHIFLIQHIMSILSPSGLVMAMGALTAFSAPQARLSLADWNQYNYFEPEGPGTYSFGYDVDDAESGNVQFRNEERSKNGTVTGSYGYVEPDGNVRMVFYTADERGYRAREESGFKLAMLKPIFLPEGPFSNQVEDGRQEALLRNKLNMVPKKQFQPQNVWNQLKTAPSSDLYKINQNLIEAEPYRYFHHR